MLKMGSLQHQQRWWQLTNFYKECMNLPLLLDANGSLLLLSKIFLNFFLISCCVLKIPVWMRHLLAKQQVSSWIPMIQLFVVLIGVVCKVCNSFIRLQLSGSKVWLFFIPLGNLTEVEAVILTKHKVVIECPYFNPQWQILLCKSKIQQERFWIRQSQCGTPQLFYIHPCCWTVQWLSWLPLFNHPQSQLAGWA